MKYSSHKDIDKRVRALLRIGWSFTRGTKHGKLRTPSGRVIVTVSVTPSCRNALQLFNSHVRRAEGR